jgi:pilus assembly protein CpaE
MAEKIRVLIVDDLQETRENVRKLLQFESDIDVIGQAANGQEAIEMTRQHRPDIILMDINMPGVDGITASQSISKLNPASQIIIMSVQSEVDYLRRAMLAGARDFLMKPFSGDELVSAVRRVHETRPAVTAPAPATQPATREGVAAPRTVTSHKEGHIITVYSPKGGSGCTTVAVNLAVALAARGHRTVVVDGSLQFGDVAVMLNLKTTTTLVDLIERITELDEDLISSLVMSHASGLKALLAPSRPEMAELVTGEHMKSLLKWLRDCFEFVIVDTSTVLDEIVLTELDLADRIVLVAQQSLPSLKNISRFFDLTQDLKYSPRKVMLVVNRESNRLSISLKDVADTLKRPVVATIPVDDGVAGEAADQGRPLVSGAWQKRPVSQALARLAEQIAQELKIKEEPVAEQVSGVSRLARLFGSR